MTHTLNIVESVGSYADDGFHAENLASLLGGHVVSPEVNAVELQLFSNLDVVVDDEYAVVVGANGLGLSGNGDDVVGGCVFHAQLHPATAACHCGAYLVEYCYVGMWVGDEL